ncbi:MAG: ABC transporter ATP-binding protein [Actinomycetales bacterium]|nr:ABC transporter ATP-binding protein [Actinomycetales bacterium]
MRDIPLLETQGITVTLGGLRVLEDVSITVPSGRVTGLIGPNGAGKTTLFNVVSGFIRPDSGVVRYRSRTRRHIRPHRLTRMGIARTLQGVGLFGSLTGLENVMLGANAGVRSGFLSSMLAMPWTDIEERGLARRARQALTDLGVDDYVNRYPDEMPYPVQKRVALARALVSDPELLLLDEPAGGIGADDIAELALLIRSWAPQRTVLLVEHHMELVMDVCEQIWVLDAGRVIARGTPAEIRGDSDVLTAYLGDSAAAAPPEPRGQA